MRMRAYYLSLLLCFAMGVPVAADPHFYLGVAYGDGVVGGELRSQSVGLPSTGDDKTRKAFAGVGLGRSLALEATYYDFGNRRVEGILDFGYDLDLTAYSAALLWTLPIDRVDLFAKAGWMRWKEEGSTISLIGVLDHDESGSNLLFGGGARFGLGERFGLRAEWERFDFDAGAEDIFSAGVELRF